MNENVLLGVVSVDESVTGFHVEPFHGSGHSVSHDLLRLLLDLDLFALVGGDFGRVVLGHFCAHFVR